MRLNQITLPACHIASVRDFYIALGFTLIVDTDHYARLEAPQGGATLSISKVDEMTSGSGPKFYLELESAAALNDKIADLERKGITFYSAPVDQPWLWREA